jgi:hypothetical protein
MKLKIIVSFFILVSMISCDENKEIKLRIKELLNKESGGFDLKYKSESLSIKDSLLIKDIMDSLNLFVINVKNDIYRDSDFIINSNTPERIDKIKGKILKMEERQRRLWSTGSLIYETDKEVSKMINSLDSIRSNYQNISPYFIWSTIIDFRKWQAYKLELYDIPSSYTLLQTDLNKAEIFENIIDSLSKYPPNKIVSLTYYNKYSIKNPLFNNAEQVLESEFIFDPEKNLLKRKEEEL